MQTGLGAEIDVVALNIITRCVAGSEREGWRSTITHELNSQLRVVNRLAAGAIQIQAGHYIAVAVLNGGDGNGPNLLIVFYVQIMPDDFIMQLHRF